MLSLLIAASAVQATITCDTGVAPLPMVLQTLSKQTGLELKVSPDLRNEPVYLRLKARTPAEVMALLAQVVGAEWRQEQSRPSYLLVRSAALRRKFAGEEIAEFSEQIRGALEKLPSIEFQYGRTSDETVKNLEAATKQRKPSAQESERYYTQMALLSPQQRLMSRLLKLADPKELASLPVARFAVWSSHPTQAQLPFRGKWSEALNAFTAEYRQLWQHLGAMDLRGRMEEAHRLNLLPLTQALPAQFITVLTCDRADLHYLRFEAHLLSMDGIEIASSQEGLMLPVQMPLDLPSLREIAKDRYRPKFNMQALDEEPQIRAELRKLLEGPEPTSPFVAEAINTLHKAAPEIAACIPDNLPYRLSFFTDEPASELLPHLNHLLRFELAPSGVLTLRPRFMASSGATRADRVALRDFLKGIADHPFKNPDLFSRYFLNQNPNAGCSRLESMLLEFAFEQRDLTSDINLFAEPWARRQSRFLSKLTLPQQRALWLGQSVPYQAIPIAAKSELNELLMLYGQGVTIDRQRWFGGNATMFLPTGVPEDAVIESEVKSSYSAVLSGSAKRVGKFWDASSLGYILFQQRENGQWLDGVGGYPVVEKSLLLPAMSERLKLRVRCTPQMSAELRVTRMSGDPSMKPAPYDQLPEAHFNELNTTYSHYIKSLRRPPNTPPLERKPPP
ncbi:MAG TPA: hypothetical protein VK934_12570 [Fimbriimonas sp.]|nr:hypothetical protein [Fimbriimonas sp.]